MTITQPLPVQLPASLLQDLVAVRDRFVQEMLRDEGFVSHDYAEPGYTMPEPTIADLPPLIVSTDWNDTCSTCGAFRSSCADKQRQPVLVRNVHTDREARQVDDLLTFVDEHFTVRSLADIRCLLETSLKADPISSLALTCIVPPAQHDFHGRVSGLLGDIIDEVGLDLDTLGQHLDDAEPDPTDHSFIEDVLCISTEWSDEWSTCDGCSRAVRTQPDCYSWKASFADFGGELLCTDCIEDYPGNYLKHVANELRDGTLLDLESHGFIRVTRDEYHRWGNGLYDHHDDDPRAQIDLLNTAGFDVAFELFPSQFTMEWDLFVRPVGMDECQGLRLDDDLEAKVIQQVRELVDNCGRCTMRPSPAEQMRRALDDASDQMASLRGEQQEHGGVIMAQCRPDGTARVRRVPDEEFIAGGMNR
jgi:hypothetical protein